MLTEEKVKSVLKTLKKYQQDLVDKGISSEDPNFIKAKFCISVLKHIELDYQKWIDNCPFSNETASEYISEKYIRLENIDDELYLSCARFLREYVLYLERIGVKDSWFRGDWVLFLRDHQDDIDDKSIISKYNKFSLDALIQGQFDVDVINHYLGNKSYQVFINYKQTVKEAESKAQLLEENLSNKQKELEEKIASFETSLNEKKEKVDQLAKTLEKQETGYNFVGLSRGFVKLLSRKRCASYLLLGLMLIIALALIALPISIIKERFLGEVNVHIVLGYLQVERIAWEQMLPIFALEFVLIYFFRVVLNRYNAIQTQIMQLELRQSLCQFIQSYAKYSKEIKKNNGISLEKFENLIFSNILSNDNNMPGTFDGIDTITKFVKDIKG